MTTSAQGVEPRGTESDQTAEARDGPFISVAICTRNRAGFLEKAALSVLPQLANDAELLIVDNGSTDATRGLSEKLAAGSPCIRVCHEPVVGLSAARNTGLRHARGKYVIFLDDDAVANPGWLAAYHRFLAAPPSDRIAVVGGAVFPDYERPPPEWMGTNANTLNLGEAAKRVTARGGPWGGNTAYLRQAAVGVGMFDPGLGRKGRALGAHEESELNLRLERAGYEIWWLPGAGVRHSISSGRLTVRWVTRSMFSEGRSSALIRLRSISTPRQRGLIRLGRVVVAPFHVAICLLAGGIALLCGRRRRAASCWFRASRIAGFTRGLLSS